MIKTILIDVKNSKFDVLNIENTLDEFYRLIDCSCIDIVRRKIGRKWFDIICDDEGLFAESPKISAINNWGRPMLVGNLLITKTGEEGETIGLNSNEISYIKKRIIPMSTRKHPEGYPMLTQVEYR